MNTIIVRGPENVGKTTTILKVFEYFTQDENAYTVIENKEKINDVSEDFCAIILYKNTKIGFFSMGDYIFEVRCALRCYECKKCDVLLCACNDKFKSLDRYINATTTIIRKDSLNKDITEDIKKLINEYIYEKNTIN